MTGKHGPPEERIWRYVTKGPDCWLWWAGGDPSGYGRIKVNGKMMGVHRLSWQIHFGPIPDGLQVLHRCDVRNCVRPDHLFLGTNADNMADMVRKGRKVYYGGRPPRRLTDLQVQEIRELNRAGVSQRDLAKRFGITQATVSRNLNR